MRETNSYQAIFDGVIGDNNLPLLGSYDFFEVGNCAQALSVFAPSEWVDIVTVLKRFSLTGDLLCATGGNDGKVPEAVNGLFFQCGWAEKQLDIETTVYAYDRGDLDGMKKRVKTQLKRERMLDAVDVDDVVQSGLELEGANNPLGEAVAAFAQTSIMDRSYQPGYYVDNCKGRVLVDVEWNPKDGNADRDLAAYRAWYEAGAIDGAVMITKEIDSCRALLEILQKAYYVEHPELRGKKRFANYKTSTTVSLTTARKRLQRGGAGPCPVLVVAVGKKTWDGSRCTGIWLKDKKDNGEEEEEDGEA